MPWYRTYIIGRADHFWGAEDIECVDDQEAIEKVRQTMDGRDVELWERRRFIVRLSSDLIPSKPPQLVAAWSAAAPVWLAPASSTWASG